MKLSHNFPLSEFTFSETAARMGREVEPTPEQIANATKLCQAVLEPIRAGLGKAVIISSGIRPDWLNAAIGGAKGSAHMTGRAADIRVSGMTPDALCRWIRRQGFPVDKCIEEFGRWTHVQIATDGNTPRHEYLTARMVNGKAVYGVLSA